MEALGKRQDGIDPVSEAGHALLLVQHAAVAEDELVGPRIRPANTTGDHSVSVSVFVC